MFMPMEGGSMRRIERDVRAAAARGAGGHGPGGHGPGGHEAAKPPMDDLIEDPEQSKRFNFFLNSLPHKGILLDAWKRDREHTSSPRDVALIKGAYDEYLHRVKEHEHLSDTINSSMSDMLEHSPTFKSLVEFNGKENVNHVLHEALRDLALAKPAEFRRIVHETHALEELRTEEARLDGVIKRFCDTRGIKEDPKLRTALALPTFHKRQAAVAKILRAKRSPVGKLASMLLGTDRSRATFVARENFLGHIEDRELTTRQAGEYFQFLLENDRDMQEGLSRLRHGERTAMPRGSEGVKSFADAKTEGMNGFTKEAAVRRAKDFRKRHAGRFEAAAWAPGPARDAELNILRNEFALEEDLKLQKYKREGFFSSLFSLLFPAREYDPAVPDAEIDNELQ